MKPACRCTLTSLVALPLLIACGTDSGEVSSAPVAPMLQLAADDPPQFSDWSAPVNLGPVVNSAAQDIEVSVSKDGLRLYLASNRSGDFDVWVSQRASVDDPWGPPQNLGPSINTPSREQAPFLTLDGHRLYFFSDRPGGLGGTDLYVSRRRDKGDDFGWQPPENLGSGVNGAFNENLSVYFEDELTGTGTLYFNSNRAGGLGATDIYASTLQPDATFGAAVRVQEISSPFADVAFAIRRDHLELFLASGSGPVDSPRPGSFGLFDLWVATRTSAADPWSTPVNLGAIVNSAADEGRGALSFDGTALYIASARPGGSGGTDLWVSTRSKLREPD